MSDEIVFLNAIADARDDNTSRLAYADWLEERGRPGGPFLRLECELAVAPTGTPAWHALFAKRRQASAGLGRDWCDLVGRYSLRRWLAESARSAWTRLENWLERHHPALRGSLGPAATPEEIAAVEAVVGRFLPPDVRESLACHNGCEQFVLGYDLLTTERVVRDWRGWRGLEHFNDEFREGMESHPTDAIALDYANAGWIPLVGDWGDNFLGIDLAPGPAGAAGQAINFGRDQEIKHVLASGWAEFLADYATILEAGLIPVLSPDPAEWRESCEAVIGGYHLWSAWTYWQREGRWPPRRLH